MMTAKVSLKKNSPPKASSLELTRVRAPRDGGTKSLANRWPIAARERRNDILRSTLSLNVQTTPSIYKHQTRSRFTLASDVSHNRTPQRRSASDERVCTPARSSITRIPPASCWNAFKYLPLTTVGSIGLHTKTNI